jgi:hypothetical protein
VPVAFEPELPLELVEPDEPAPPSELVVELVEPAGFAAPPSPFVSLFVSGFDSPADFWGALPYKSAYQPPPFRMNPAPPET